MTLKPSRKDMLVRNHLAANPAGRIISELATCVSYENFVSVLNRAIDFIASNMAMNPDENGKLTENQLTVRVADGLKFLTFSARHDVKVGGHCDIVVEWGDAGLWAAEAKIFKDDYTWLYKGFQQLSTRYTTGAVNQNTGAILIYIITPNARKIMGKWTARLLDERPDIYISPCDKDPLAVITQHEHERSGLKLTVRHKPFLLCHDPHDRKAK
ncbi:hypothetical protein [Rhizobium phaseoli]|uniref:hypothetical protein n=1 Tax=Rhizobium phaseoli TaxID=396 RepID=UPI0007F179C0|nr:hypothetical protein [Rhizobium phaseoli]ANL38325.1 hypothetical protein AMC89_PD00867 [Rhizobium phaseoli]ANM02029.1 hypothetical protein AMC79_PD00864 [Rhizobium phaseoli]